jgi:hypothetical protein
VERDVGSGYSGAAELKAATAVCPGSFCVYVEVVDKVALCRGDDFERARIGYVDVT